MEAEVYSKPNCPFCVQAKVLLERRGVPVTPRDAVAEREALIERVTADTGNPPRTVPQIYIDGKHVGGYDDLVVFFKRLDVENDDGA